MEGAGVELETIRRLRSRRALRLLLLLALLLGNAILQVLVVQHHGHFRVCACFFSG